MRVVVKYYKDGYGESGNKYECEAINFEGSFVILTLRTNGLDVDYVAIPSNKIIEICWTGQRQLW